MKLVITNHWRTLDALEGLKDKNSNPTKVSQIEFFLHIP